MAYTIIEPRLGLQPIAVVLSALSVNAITPVNGNIRPGTRIRAQDQVLGGGEFIYLPTVASVTVGSLVTFRESASGVFTTAVTPNTANLGQPVAVAMAAGVASNYGWFGVAGTFPIKKTAIKVNPNVALFLGATTGRVTSSIGAGKQLLGVRSSNTATVASATSSVTVTINNPHLQGQIT